MSNLLLSRIQTLAKVDLSSQELQEILAFADRSFEPHLELLSACLTHLDATIIPQQATRKDLNVALLANISVMGLCTLANHPSDVLRRSLLEAWPPIWRWMEFLQQHFFFEAQSPLYMGIDIGNAFCAINVLLLYKLRDMGIPNTHIARAPGVTSMIIKIWVRTLEKGASQDLHAQACDFLGEFIHEQGPPHVAEEIDDVLHRQVAKVAASALKHLGAHLVGATPKYELFACDLRSLIAIHIILGPAADWWFNALLTHHSIKVVTSSLVDLTSKPFSHTTATDILCCLNICHSYLAVHLKSTDGFTWVTQALNAHLLPAMLNSGGWMPDNPNCPRLTILTDILPGYLIYHSVLRAVQRSIEGTTAQNIICSSNGKLFRDSWTRFIALAQERLALKLEFDNGNIPTVTCNDTNCNAVGSESEFLLCAGCLIARYCGKNCQQRDWKKSGNHRVICKNIQARRRDGIVEPLSKRDDSFMKIVAFRDTSKHYAHIRRLKANCLLHNPSGNPKLLVISSDYTTFPLTITVNPVEHYRPHARTSNIHARAQYDDLVGMAIKEEGKTVIQIITVPRGASAQKYWVLRPVAQLGAELLRGLAERDFGTISTELQRMMFDMQ